MTDQKPGLDTQRTAHVRRMTTHRVQQMKERGEPITMITAYDYTSARLVDSTGIPLILVGDSLGQVMLGFDSTVPVTVDDIVRHTAAVVRGAQRAMVIADMPFMSYHVTPEIALANAGRLLQEGGAQAVKLEGGRPVAPVVQRMSDAGIAVMGHVGLTPQHIHKLGGHRVQGRDDRAANGLIEDALAIEEAGAFAVVLELIPKELAATITERLRIPTIGIGAGPHCSGQVQVLHDILGLSERKLKHARRYAELAPVIQSALQQYADDVRSGAFPSEAESFSAADYAPEADRAKTVKAANEGH